VGKIVDVFWMSFSQARQRTPTPSNPEPMAIVRHYGNIQKLLDEMRVQRGGLDAAALN